MVRNFSFKWHKNEKYGTPILRVNAITVSNASADTGHAAKAATDIFCKTFGNLKQIPLSLFRNIMKMVQLENLLCQLMTALLYQQESNGWVHQR